MDGGESFIRFLCQRREAPERTRQGIPRTGQTLPVRGFKWLSTMASWKCTCFEWVGIPQLEQEDQ